ncbi:general odorant-binding protein 84a [Maniola hyperantus]|uniref:general odorant-binding protein 84a n=1 Tax=Aphantopus hyperantus TaxID=2795564 RepID=UPI001569CE37|nr:general odorant-binding protein 84a [Maniola hyperantus]
MNQIMNLVYAIAFALITFSVTECTDAKDKSNSKDMASGVQTTKVSASIEERDNIEEFNLIEVMVECNDSFRVEMSYLESFNKSGSLPDETDKTPKCYMRCVLEKAGIASPASQFNVKRTAEIFPQLRDVPEEDIIKMATACTDRPETCKCERSYQYLKCLMEAVIEKYDLER